MQLKKLLLIVLFRFDGMKDLLFSFCVKLKLDYFDPKLASTHISFISHSGVFKLQRLRERLLLQNWPAEPLPKVTKEQM